MGSPWAVFQNRLGLYLCIGGTRRAEGQTMGGSTWLPEGSCSLTAANVNSLKSCNEWMLICGHLFTNFSYVVQVSFRVELRAWSGCLHLWKWRVWLSVLWERLSCGDHLLRAKLTCVECCLCQAVLFSFINFVDSLWVSHHASWSYPSSSPFISTRCPCNLPPTK